MNKPNSYDPDDDLSPDYEPHVEPTKFDEVMMQQEEYMRVRLGEEVWKMLEKRT